jgi:hypothetical protein
MATERQILANRLNALRSRGPKTEEGGAASRCNALKYGLTACSLIIEVANPDLFETMRTELFIAHGSHGVLEEQLFDLMVEILWRLRCWTVTIAGFSIAPRGGAFGSPGALSEELRLCRTVCANAVISFAIFCLALSAARPFVWSSMP